jgi:hypothetical protein
MTKARRKPSPKFIRERERESLNAKIYKCVQKILKDGCSKKSAAVREAAIALRRSERSIWTSLREHDRELRWQAEEERRMRIRLGEEEPTDEDMEEAFEREVQFLIDLKRGK